MSLFKPARPVYLVGPVSYLPERVVDNPALLAWMGVEVRPSWISHRTGIQERRWAEDSQACSDLAIAAARRLFEQYGVDRSRITQLVLATVSGDFPSPPTSPLVLPGLGLEAIGVLDLGAACAGFTSGLYTCAALALATGGEQLLIASEIRSKFLNKEDLATAALFGDGAAACLVSPEPARASFQLLAAELSADSSVADIIAIRAGGSRLPFHQSQEEENAFLKMQKGATLFMKGVELMSSSAASLLRQLEMKVEDIDWVVPHQANLHLVRATMDKLGVAAGKVVETVQFTGNTSGASVGIALAHLREKLPLRAGQKVLLVSAGAGGSSACALLVSL